MSPARSTGSRYRPSWCANWPTPSACCPDPPPSLTSTPTPTPTPTARPNRPPHPPPATNTAPDPAPDPAAGPDPPAPPAPQREAEPHPQPTTEPEVTERSAAVAAAADALARAGNEQAAADFAALLGLRS